MTLRGNNKYTETVLTIIESGAIYAIATLIVFALDIAGSPAGFVGVTGIIQLAVSTIKVTIKMLLIAMDHRQ